MYIAVTTVNLANYRPISGDGAWILSASHKLARQGIFGSDMFTGFFNADQHYFIALPGQHVLQAVALWLLGDGIAQARWVLVLSGVALLWAVSLLAWRWYGVTVAVLTGLLLMAWQPMLIGNEGVPLISLGRSLRYDLMREPDRFKFLINQTGAGVGPWLLLHLALNNLSGQWLIQRERTGQTPSFADVMATVGVEYVLISRGVHGDMKRYSGAVEQPFWTFIEACTTLQEKWQDPWYREISLHAVRPGCHPDVEQSTVHDE